MLHKWVQHRMLRKLKIPDYIYIYIYIYEKALKEAGHRTNMTYTPKCDTNTRQHKRKRKVTWFNPPYSQHVKTKIGEKFLKIVEKNFPKENQLHKICNRNTLRLSYSCMDNMQQSSRHTITPS